MIEIILIIAAVMINSPFQPGDFPLDPPLRRNFLTLTSHYLEFISCSLLVAKFLSLCKFFTYYLLLTIQISLAARFKFNCYSFQK